MSTAQAAQLEISTPMPARKRRKGLTSSFSATSISAYLGVFLLVMSLVAISYQTPERKGALATAGVQQVDAAVSISPEGTGPTGQVSAHASARSG